VDHDIVEFSGWKLDLSAYRLLAPGGDEVKLTTAEFMLLRVFVECSGRVLSRDFLSDRMRGREWDGYDRGIDGLVSRLRRIIDPPSGQASLIKTVRGAGYMFTEKVSKQ